MDSILRKALLFNDQVSMQEVSKYIAFHVKKELENFVSRQHDKTDSGTDDCIKNGIYNALFTLANSTVDTECFKIY